MAIMGGLDLIADVIANADPASKRHTLDQLATIGKSSGIRIDQASADLRALSSSSFGEVLAASADGATSRNFNLRLESVGSAQSSVNAAQQFEAFFLSQFFEKMLPADINADESGSSQISADMARSQMASAMASQLSEQGGVGIAEQIRAARVTPVSQQEPASTQFMHKQISILDHVEPTNVSSVQPDFIPPAQQLGGSVTGRAARFEEMGTPGVQVAAPSVESTIGAVFTAIERFFVMIGGTGSASDRLRTRS